MGDRRIDDQITNLAHELRALYFGAGSDNLGLTGTLGLGGHGERILQVLVENQVLDEHGLDFNTPSGGRLLDDLANGLCDLLTALNNVLEYAGTDDVAQCRLGALDESLADIGNTEGGLVWRGDAVVDD